MDKAPVTTMGGLKILPDITLRECNPENAAALVLPGGDTWMEAIHEPILTTAEQFLNQGVLVAAICGATMALARKGLLDSRLHTSNDLGFLKIVCPGYKGEQYYVHEPAVTDGNLITASSVASLEFAFHVLRALDTIPPQTLNAWYNLNKYQEPKYFFELMESVQ